MQRTFATKNYLIALDMLHKTLVANVDKINDQLIFHHLYIIIVICILPKKSTIMTLQMKKVWEIKNKEKIVDPHIFYFKWF